MESSFDAKLVFAIFINHLTIKLTVLPYSVVILHLQMILVPQ